MPSAGAPPPSRRIPELDGLRGLACLMILLRHLVLLEIPPGTKGFWGGMNILLSQTWSGVDLFFVLSGFLIFSKLMQEKGGRDWIGRFWLDRGFRLLPLYLLLLLCYYALRSLPIASPFWAALFQDRLPGWAHLFFVQNWYSAINAQSDSEFLTVTWSLCAEIEFYLLATLLVWLVARRQFIASLVSCLLLCWLVRFALYIYQPGSFLLAYLLPPARMDGFMLGGLIACLYAPQWGAPGAGITPKLLSLPVAILGLGFAVLTLNRVPPSGEFSATVSYGWLAIFYASAVFYAVAASGRGGIPLLRRGALPALGTISYGVYLIHLPVHYMFNAALGSPDAYVTSARGLVCLFAELLLTLTLASASWFLFERRLIRWGKARMCLKDEKDGDERIYG